MRTLVIFPLQEELDFFLASCQRRSIRWIQSSIGRLPSYASPALDLTLARGGTGKAQFALQTQHLLDADLSWDIVICAGAAGALVDELAIADIVVATITVEHDYRNRFGERPLPAFNGAQPAIDELRALRSTRLNFALHFGPVASGDEDIVDKTRRRALHDQTGALAAAWEGAGGARACAFVGVPFLEIRGVTDAADAGAPADFEANLELAMSHIAALVIAWLKHRR